MTKDLKAQTICYPTITVKDYGELAKGTLRESQNEFLDILNRQNVFVESTNRTHRAGDESDLDGWVEFNKAVFEFIQNKVG